MDEKIIIISTEKTSIRARLNQTNTAKKLIEILPLSSIASRWGDEIYFSISLQADIEDGVEEVDAGTIAFWPPGSAFCIFFGRTPASRTDKPQAASPVTVIGNIIEEDINGREIIKELKQVKSGEKISIALEKKSSLM